MTPLVSVIVPVYKVEPYLRQCIDSILEQTYQNIEVILVDDGSPDRCGAICDRYGQKDPRVQVIHKTNGGLSEARNFGMKAAEGAFYCFVDSDDYLPEYAVETLVRHALSSRADIVCADHQSFVDGSEPGPQETMGEKILLDRVAAMEWFAMQDWGAWAKLYRREIHENVLFPVGKIHEDETVMFQLLDRCERVLCIPDRLYYYRQRSGSITASGYSIRKMDWTDGWIKNAAFVREKYPSVYPKCLSKAWTTALYNLGYLMGRPEYKPQLMQIRDFVLQNKKDIFSDPYISKAGKLRAALFLISDPISGHSAYLCFYRILNKWRGQSHEK